jgi:hypothetical protein
MGRKSCCEPEQPKCQSQRTHTFIVVWGPCLDLGTSACVTPYELFQRIFLNEATVYTDLVIGRMLRSGPNVETGSQPGF